MNGLKKKKEMVITMSSDKGLAHQYQKKTDKEHILDNPDTYIGSVDNLENETHVFDHDSKRIKKPKLLISL